MNCARARTRRLTSRGVNLAEATRSRAKPLSCLFVSSRSYHESIRGDLDSRKSETIQHQIVGSSCRIISSTQLLTCAAEKALRYRGFSRACLARVDFHVGLLV